jgi:hypothetical protein
MSKATGESFAGRSMLVAFDTVHIDRAGETSSLICTRAEIAGTMSSRSVIAVTTGGEHVVVPLAAIHEDVDDAALFAAHRLIRDFHSVESPLRSEWLERDEALELVRGESS